MADKIITIPRRSLGTRVGELGGPDMARLETALRVFPVVFFGFVR